MLLERLSIEAFRGIRNSIELPFDAPITVLLAANGTAKTSVCDAAEWLLTGRVRRLQDGLVSADLVRNRFAESRRVRVSAIAHWENNPREIVRTDPQSIGIPGTRNASSKPTSNSKFLEQLTPDYVGQTLRTRNVEEPRAEWLRAVRFFNSDGLTLLLDDNEDAERVRGIAFAEMLGVGPVGRRIEGLKGVRLQIDSPKAALTAVADKIAVLENQLKAAQAAASEPYLTRVDTLLREIATTTGVALPDTIARRREVLLALTERLSVADRALNLQRAELAKVRDTFPAFLPAQSLLRNWEDQQKPAFNLEMRQKHDERATIARIVKERATLSSELTKRLGELNILLGQTQAALATVREASSQELDSSAVGRARTLRDEALANEKAAQSQLQKWKRFADEFAQGQRAFLQLETLEKQRLELAQTIPSPQDQDAVERRLRDARLALTEQRAQLKANNDRWQQWGAEVRAQARHWTGQSSCPLCGHEHGDAERLRSAIDEVLSRQPAANQETAERLARLEVVVAELNASSTILAERRRQLGEVEKKIATLRTQNTRFLALIQERGLDSQFLTRSDAAEVVASRVRNADQTAAAAAVVTKRAADAVSGAERLHARLFETAQALRTALPSQAPTPDLPTDPSLQARAREVEALIAAAQRQTEVLRNEYEHVVRDTELSRERLLTLETGIRQRQDVFDSLARQAEEARRVVLSVEGPWRGISTEPLDSAALERIAASQAERADVLRRDREQLAQAEQYLALADNASREEANRNEANQALASNRAEHAALVRVELLRTKLDAEIAEAEQHLSRLLSTQIRPLLRSISSFYLRAQGNPFIDKIGVDDSPNTNVLRWLGELADARALTAGEMSQGQRQDLALSIFLARARRERGTFLLDEPLAHLDDLNRVAFFDTLRAMVVQSVAHVPPFRLVVTTASWSLVRHLRAKFQRVCDATGRPTLRVIELVGDPRTGIEVRQQA